MTEKNLKLSDLIEDDKNYNKGNDAGKALIGKSLKEFGAGRSILLDKNNRIIAGNKTVQNAAAAGLSDVIVVETTGGQVVAVRRMDVDLDSKIGRQMALADNATAKANIEWDLDALNSDWSGDEQSDWGIIQAFTIVPQAEQDDYEIPDQIVTDIVSGDIFEIGPHRLLCGDCTQTDTWGQLLGEQLVDLVVTDPPYNVDYTGKTKSALKIDNDKMDDDTFYQFLYDFYTALASFTKPGGAWYVWHADSEGANFRTAMAEAGIKVRECLIWVKNSMVMGRQDYHWQHEPCLYGWKEGAAHGWYADRKQTTVLNFDRPLRNAEHPTMKPVPLIAYQVENSSKQGDIVADGFMGSGTTMVAAHQLERRCFGMEIDPKYCQVVLDRMKKLDPSLPIKKNGLTVE